MSDKEATKDLILRRLGISAEQVEKIDRELRSQGVNIEMVEAVPDQLVRDIVSDSRRSSPTQPRSLAYDENRGIGQSQRPRFVADRPQGPDQSTIDYCDRLVDAADKAERIRRLKGEG